MKKVVLSLGLLTVFMLAACNNTKQEEIGTPLEADSEGIEFLETDSTDILSEKWNNYVDSYIALENDSCENYIFVDKDETSYGVYNCHQTATEEGLTDYLRSGIYNIFNDEWILTCNEANGEQGVGFDQERFGEYNNDKTCKELATYIEEKIENN